MHATTLDAVVSDATARARLTMLLLALAAAATLLLGAVGLYSVIAYAVAGRAPEFAVRLALGATAPEIVGLVLREGALLAATGLAVGIALSLGSARFIRGVLYEVSPTNPATYLAAAILLLLTALVAMYLPARRAGRTDPATVLRG
jgi:ABC-type antimicrobial peptide transport system permease subunit